MNLLSEIEKTNLLNILKKAQVIRFGNFTLKDGTISPVYIDLRVLPNCPKEFQEVLEIIKRNMHKNDLISKFDGIIAPPLAGIPLAVGIALTTGKEFFLARLQPKEYGTQKLIEGNIMNKNILVVDDVITSGESKIPIIRLIRNHGGLVTNLFVFINRMLPIKIKEFCIRNSIEINYLLTLEEILENNKK